MEVNILFLVILGVFVIALVVFIIIRDIKDKDDFVESLNAADDLL
jgi:hypothetical protein